jgi:hypothetical protein
VVSSIVFDPDSPLSRCRGELPRAHDALLDYYRLGSGRSLRAIHAEYRERSESEGITKVPTKRFATLSKWSTANRWQERIELQSRIDLETERRMKEEALRAEAEKWAQRQLDVRERDWQQGEELRVLVDRILGESPKFIKNSRRFIPGRNGDPDREIITVGIDAKLMTNALVAASKLQRLAAEMETDHTLNDNVNEESIEDVRKKRWEKAQAAIEDAIGGSAPAEEDDGGEERE